MFAFIELILNMVKDVLYALSGYIDTNLNTNILTLNITLYGGSITLLDFMVTLITVIIVSWITYKVIMLPLQVIRKIKGDIL